MIHEEIAMHTGWTVEQCQSLSLAALREVVRRDRPDLARRIDRILATGAHVRGAHVPTDGDLLSDAEWTARFGR